MRRAAALLVVLTTVASACSSDVELSEAARQVLGDDADCVEEALGDRTIRTLNDTFERGPATLPAEVAEDLREASAACDRTAPPTADASSAGSDPASNPGEPGEPVTGIGQDPVDPDAEVVAGRDAPLELPATVTLAGWDITVLAGRQETGPPAERSPEGGLYVITVRGTNHSGGESDLFFDLDWGTIAADGVIYENTCEVALEDDLAFADSAPEGGTQEGSFCLTMPPSVAAEVTDFYLQEALTPAQAIAWFTTR